MPARRTVSASWSRRLRCNCWPSPSVRVVSAPSTPSIASVTTRKRLREAVLRCVEDVRVGEHLLQLGQVAQRAAQLRRVDGHRPVGLQLEADVREVAEDRRGARGGAGQRAQLALQADGGAVALQEAALLGGRVVLGVGGDQLDHRRVGGGELGDRLLQRFRVGDDVDRHRPGGHGGEVERQAVDDVGQRVARRRHGQPVDRRRGVGGGLALRHRRHAARRIEGEGGDARGAKAVGRARIRSSGSAGASRWRRS